jgi:hypothetical protein
MKALRYLQKVGAVPEYENWDLLMSLVVICNELYSPEVMVEPDVIEWVQASESDEEFIKRCDCILFGTSGDVRAFFPHIHKQPSSFLKELIEVLLETRLALFCICDGKNFNLDDEGWFINEYNNRVGLKGKKRFPSKSSVLHTYYSGSLTDVGQQILSEIAGTKVDFAAKISKMQSEFSSFLMEQQTAVIDEVEIKSEFGNPFEGGYEVCLTLKVIGSDELHKCTLHWAPWPTAKTKSTHLEMSNICNFFNNSQREKWFLTQRSETANP